MDKILDKLMLMMKRNNACADEDDEIIRYGLEILFMKIIMYAAFLIIGILTKSLIQILCFMLAYQPLRTYSGGYHQKTRMGCFIFSVLMFLSVVSAVKLISQGIIHFLVPCLMLPAIPAILLLAPMDTPDKPLEETERKVFRKRVYILLTAEVLAAAVLWFVRYDTLAFPIAIGVFADALLMIIGFICKSEK